MSTRAQLLTFASANGLRIAMAAVMLGGLGLGVRWIATNRDSPAPRKVMQFSMVRLPPPPPPKVAPPPPPQVTPQKVEEQEEQRDRVELKPMQTLPPDEPKPDPGSGRLSLAAEGDGPGDAFNLVGNPGGRGLLSGGGLGDGSGDGIGSGDGLAQRYGWYYAKIASDIEDRLRRSKKLQTASVRVEIRVWAEPGGRISRVQLVRATGQPEIDEAIRGLAGIELRTPPPDDIPMPMIARLTVRRPQ